MPGTLHLGHVRIPVFGLFAAAGLVAALSLSQRTARHAHLEPESLWNAGLIAIIAAFLVSRALLILQNPHAFLRYPILVLELPSLTYLGLALTAALTYAYLRRKRLPLLNVLDAWSPCAPLCLAFLALGHFLEGTEAGMPTNLPWGVHTPGDTILGRVHPVQLYFLAAWLWLTLHLFRLLRRPHASGAVASRALYLGGTLAFVLYFFAQPTDTFGAAFLDPGQYVALACFAIGLALQRHRFLHLPQPQLQTQEHA